MQHELDYDAVLLHTARKGKFGAEDEGYGKEGLKLYGTRVSKFPEAETALACLKLCAIYY